MSKIVSIVNRKGGIGKSTTALALGTGLSSKGYKVLLVDLDSQCNLSYVANALNPKLSSLELLSGEATAKDTIIKSNIGDIIPASRNLAGADIIFNGVGKEYKLKEALEPIKKNYDYIVIDTPPALGILTTNAMVTSDTLIIPSEADMFSLQGLGQLSQTISVIRKYCNEHLKIDGILITRYNGRTVLSKDLSIATEQTAQALNTKVYKTRIRNCVSIKEANAEQKDIFTYAPRSNASLDYMDFINEFLEDNK